MREPRAAGWQVLAKYVAPMGALATLALGALMVLDGRLPTKSAEAAPQVTSGSQRSILPATEISASRVALIIANASYPDAHAPLEHSINDAEALANELHGQGFAVEVRQNAGKEEMRRAIDSFTDRLRPGVVALISYSGFGIQVNRQSYMIPVDARIWKEADVRRDGVSVEAVLAGLNGRGVSAKLVILDASRRNPFERRFRTLSAGLAAIDAPQGTLLMSAAAPGSVAYDAGGTHSVLMENLLREMKAPGMTAEDIFNRTRMSVSRATKGEQVPSVSSSLLEGIALRHDAKQRS